VNYYIACFYLRKQKDTLSIFINLREGFYDEKSKQEIIIIKLIYSLLIDIVII